MTDVDLGLVTTRFITLAEELVGPKLAVFGEAPNDSPAVFDTIHPNRTGEYPYILVNLANISDQAYRLYDHYNESDEKETWSSYDVLMTYTVFSSDNTTYSAQQIAFELKSALARKEVLTRYAEGKLGNVIRVDPININYSNRNDEVAQVAAFNVLYTVLSIETNTDNPVQVIEASVDEKFEGDDTILHSFEINVDTTET